MSTQGELNFDIAEPDVKNLVDMVLTLMKNGKYWAPWELCEEIWRTRGIKVSDSSITARIRDARKEAYGSHNIEIRRRSGTRFFEYRMEK